MVIGNIRERTFFHLYFTVLLCAALVNQGGLRPVMGLARLVQLGCMVGGVRTIWSKVNEWGDVTLDIASVTRCRVCDRYLELTMEGS